MSFDSRAVGPEQSDSIHIINWDRVAADNAYAVHLALLGLEALRPELKDNPAWDSVRRFGYAQFEDAYEKVTA
jgi:hypothetical protein